MSSQSGQPAAINSMSSGDLASMQPAGAQGHAHNMPEAGPGIWTNPVGEGGNATDLHTGGGIDVGSSKSMNDIFGEINQNAALQDNQPIDLGNQGPANGLEQCIPSSLQTEHPDLSHVGAAEQTHAGAGVNVRGGGISQAQGQ